MTKTSVWSLGWEDPLEKGMATHSSILAWEIPWTEEPGELQSMESQRVRHYWLISIWASWVAQVVKNLLSMWRPGLRPLFDPWAWKMPQRRKRLHTPVCLTGESYRQRNLAGYSSPMGSQRFGHDWVTNWLVGKVQLAPENVSSVYNERKEF